MGILIDRDRCICCGACVGACPNGTIETDGSVAVVAEENCVLCGACVDACPMGAISLERKARQAEESKGGVWVAVQQLEGEPLPVAYQLLGKGRELADALACELTAVCLGCGDGFATSLIESGADKVLLCKSDMISLVDSLTAPFSIANALIVAIASRRERELQKTFSSLEQVWEEYQVYEKRVDV